MKDEFLSATFEIQRYSDTEFKLVIEDKASGLVVMSAKVAPADLILAISGRGGLPLVYQPTVPFAYENSGKTHESRKVVLIGTEAALAKQRCPDRFRDKDQFEAKAEEFKEWVRQVAVEAVRVEDGEAYRPGWILFRDGSESQQQRGTWTLFLHRYDDPPTPPDHGPEVGA